MSRFLLMLAGLGAAASVHPAEAATAPGSFSDLGLEELMNVEVVEVGSVSRQTRPLAETAAAAFVISGEDIRRSGATSIPDALRMVPGVEVARIDANKWAVTIRGFNGRFADKLLVLIDGMSVYTPFFCNVFWDVQDVPLDDIARIEVIRGPGGSIWGANAVNGVINIITKRAEETQGAFLSTTAGSQPSGSATARYGGRIGADTFYRGYVKGLEQGDSGRPEGSDIGAADAWNQRQAGFRLDTKTAVGDPVTVSGQLYRGNYGTTGINAPLLTPPYAVTFDDTGDVSGVNLLGNWQHQLTEHSAVETRAYYRRDNRKEQGLIFNLDTVDLDVHHQYRGLRAQVISTGLGYRFINNRLDGTFPLSFVPDQRRDHLFSAFLQDEISLVPDRLRLTVGAKLEDNASTGFEVQPSVRGIWTPNRRNALWAAASRAVRTPRIAEDDVRLNAQTIPPGAPGNPFPAPVLIRLVGDSDLEAEELYALEAGYRVSPARTLSLDVATFLNIYNSLRTFSAATPGFELEPRPPHGLVPIVAAINGVINIITKSAKDTQGALVPPSLAPESAAVPLGSAARPATSCTTGVMRNPSSSTTARCPRETRARMTRSRRGPGSASTGSRPAGTSSPSAATSTSRTTARHDFLSRSPRRHTSLRTATAARAAAATFSAAGAASSPKSPAPACRPTTTASRSRSRGSA